MDTTVLNIKTFPADLHRQAKIAALTEGKTLKEWIIEAMKEKMERSQEKK